MTDATSETTLRHRGGGGDRTKMSGAVGVSKPPPLTIPPNPHTIAPVSPSHLKNITNTRSLLTSHFTSRICGTMLLTYFGLLTWSMSPWYPQALLGERCVAASRVEFDYKLAVVAPLVGLMIDGVARVFAIGSWSRHTATFSCTIHVMMFAFALGHVLEVFPVCEANGRIVLPARYLMWMSTTPLIITFLSSLALLPIRKYYILLVCDFIMLLFGYLSSTLPGNQGAFFAVISHIAGMFVISGVKEIITDMHSRAHETSRSPLIFAQFWFTVSWSAFPVVWHLARWGFVSNAHEHMLYAIADTTAKVVLASAVQTYAFNQEHVQALDLMMRQGRESEKQNQQSFLRYVFHEVRVPLNCLILGVEHMKFAESGDTDAQEVMSMMSESSAAMRRVLDDVLMLERLEENKLQLEKAPFSLQRSIDVVKHMFTAQLEAKKLNLELELDSAIPMLLGDKYRVRQIISNYLSNAVKFSPEGAKVLISLQAVAADERCSILSSSPRVVTTPRSRAFARISVRDYGVGMSEEDQKRIFQPFAQIQAGALQKGGGSGLGLSICKRLAALFGGRVGFASQVGQGSVFYIDIPLNFAPPGSIEADSEESPSSPRKASLPSRSLSSAGAGKPQVPALTALTQQGPNSPSHHTNSPRARLSLHPTFPAPETKLKVLMVDDSAINRKMLGKMLTNAGMEVQYAEDGQQAVESASEYNPFDVILMDLNLPILDGPSAVRLMRANGVKCPILGVTGSSLEKDKERMISAGVNTVLVKPVQFSNLMETIYKHIADSKLQNIDREASQQ